MAKAETVQEQCERLSDFTCRMEELERGSLRRFFLEQIKGVERHSPQHAILDYLAGGRAQPVNPRRR